MGGLVLLVVGSNWMVDGAGEIAEGFGLSELVIGLTIVAAGTSPPELVWNSSDSGAPSWYADNVWFVLVPLAVVMVLGTAWRDRHQIPHATLR